MKFLLHLKEHVSIHGRYIWPVKEQALPVLFGLSKNTVCCDQLIKYIDTIHSAVEVSNALWLLDADILVEPAKISI